MASRKLLRPVSNDSPPSDRATREDQQCLNEPLTRAINRGGLAVALTVADVVADVANTAGENVTTALRADLKEFKAETDTRFAEVNARFTEVRADIKELAGSIQSLHREVATLRWMIGIGFTLLSIFLALSTFLRA